jgi:NADPH:quinone reductase-like Zn-dependent oxidoreductase
MTITTKHHWESAVKAIRYHEFGSTEVLRQEEVERPVPGAGQVLVKVAATSFNPVDDHIRLGVLAEMIPTPLPITPGLDVAGTVAELGEGVSGLRVGDQVIAMFPLDVHGGAAEYAIVAADLVTSAPRSIALADAASLPLTGLAARQAVVELAGIRAGQTVLVNGAGGAVGSIVVQLAADAGAKVTAVDGPQHADRLSGYGAGKVVGPLDLVAGPAAVGGPFDVVVNHVRLAPEDLARLTPYVADGGIVVSSAGPVPADEARSVRTAGVWVSPNASHLADLVARVDSGRLTLHIADHRALEELPTVHRDASNGKLLGKTVIVVA